MEIPARQFLSTAELLKSGLSHYKLNKLVAEGKLVKRSNKLYENTAYEGETSDLAVASAFIPNGIICMMTAARYYELTTYLPNSVDVAIERSMKVSTMPDWPDIHLWYFPKERYESGVVSISENNERYRIYDPEKTVADILYYRNKVGIAETKEILRNYLGRESRNLAALHRYAASLGCGKILSTYLEVLL